MKKISLYIGADNKTKEVNIEKMETVLNFHYQGYTVIRSMGYWNGIKENSVIVQVFTENYIENEVLLLVERLKTALEQQSIILEVVNSDTRFL